MEKKITDSAKRATVIVASQDRGTVSSIYKDLMQADLNADVFDYFENEIEFCDLQFEFAGKKYDLFQHSLEYTTLWANGLLIITKET